MDSDREPDHANACEFENVMSWKSIETNIAQMQAKADELASVVKALKNARLQNEMVLLTLKSQREDHAAALAELKSKKMQVDNEIQSQLVLMKELKAKCEECEERRFSMLDEFNDDVMILSKRFLTAPDCYGIDKITDEIDNYVDEIQNIEDQIDSVCDPEISRLDRLIEEEPVTNEELPGFQPRNYSASELSILVSRIQESAKNYKQMNDNLVKKLEELKKKEESLNCAYVLKFVGA